VPQDNEDARFTQSTVANWQFAPKCVKMAVIAADGRSEKPDLRANLDVEKQQ
jgi:hypothetical protein